MISELLVHGAAFAAMSGLAISAGWTWRAQKNLRAMASHYRLMFQQNPQPMWVYDRETYRVLDVNDAAAQQYGYTKAEMRQFSLHDLQLRSADGAEPDFTLLTPGSTRHVVHQRRDGKRIDVEIRADSILFRGRPARLVLATDVTEAMRIAHELERSASLRLATLQATADGIVV